MSIGTYAMTNDDEWNPLAHPSHYFSRIGRAQTRIGDARLRAVGLATAQLPVLSMLSGGRQLSQIELARQARVEQPSMAQLLTRMERDGLIKRVPDPADRRSSLIMLTEEAARRLPAGRAILRQSNVEMMQGMSAAETAQLLSLLQRVLDNVDGIET
jgi:MarR family transcriptional regulator for hemolysin